MAELIDDDARADCCGIARIHAEQDGFELVRVGAVLVCGECLLAAGVIEEAEE